MKFAIIGYSEDDHRALRASITREKYEELSESCRFVLTALRIEEDFDLLVESFIEFDVSLLEAAARHAVIAIADYADLYPTKSLISRRLFNFLCAVRLYRDHTKGTTARLYGRDSGQHSSFCEAWSAASKESLEFRTMEWLRDHSQHAGPPMHGLRLQMRRQSSRVSQSADATINVEELTTSRTDDKELLERLKNEYGGTFELARFTKSYASRLGHVHDGLRSQMRNDVAKHGEALASAANTLAEESGCSGVHKRIVDIARFDSQDRILDSAHLAVEASELYWRLHNANCRLKHAERFFVSGRAQE